MQRKLRIKIIIFLTTVFVLVFLLRIGLIIHYKINAAGISITIDGISENEKDAIRVYQSKGLKKKKNYQ